MLEIPGYTIEKELGHGGMAAVYLATQEFTKRKVAIKVMSPALAVDPSFSERFLKEATCANLSHPNIITVYDAGEINKQNYIVMEYASGGDLASALRKGMTIYESVKVMKQIASALAYAHERGYVHRDVKPDNILLRADGTAVLVDFGIAKASTANTKMTAVGMTIGSPHYMSPEQARAKDLDGRSDIYSLGIVFYELLTGNKPYDAEDTYAIAYMHVNDPPPKLPAQWAFLQPTLDRMLAKDPASRFPDANALLDALENVQPPPGPERASMATTVLMGAESAPPAKKSPALFAIAGAVIALVVLGAVYLLQSQSTQEATSERAPVPQPARVDPQIAERQYSEQQAAAEQASREEKIGALLTRADAYLKTNALTKPPQANALQLYRQVLVLDPGNAQAADGVHRIASTIFTLADARKAKGDLAGALVLVDDGLAVEADHAQLLKLKEELERSIAQRQKDIDSRLAKAAEFLAKGALIEPAGANAYSEYQNVLSLDAQNRLALQGKADITERVVNAIEREITEQRFDAAQTQLAAARTALGDSSKLAALSTQLTQAKRDFQADEQRRKDEQQRQTLLDEQRRMLEEIKKAQEELAKVKAAPPARNAAPNQLPIADKGKIAIVVRFLAAPKSPLPTPELMKKLGSMMRIVLSDFVPADTQFEVIDDQDISARMRTEGDRAETSQRICADRQAEYTFGGLMEDFAGSPDRRVDLVVYDCGTGKRTKTSVTTGKTERLRVIKEAFEPFLKKYVGTLY